MVDQPKFGKFKSPTERVQQEQKTQSQQPHPVEPTEEELVAARPLSTIDPENVTEEDKKIIQRLVEVYKMWRLHLDYYEPGDLYQMLADVTGAIIEIETADYQLQIEELTDSLNECRAKLGLKPLIDEDDDEEKEG